MMSFHLGQCANTIRKSQRLGKIREAKCSLEPCDAVTLVESPFDYLGLQFPNIRIRYPGRVAPTGCTLFVSQFAYEFTCNETRLPSLLNVQSHYFPHPSGMTLFIGNDNPKRAFRS